MSAMRNGELAVGESLDLSPAALVQVAFLLTCHNRVNKTLACLSAIQSQQTSLPVAISVFLVDDGSTDGTTSAVHHAFPSVSVIQGSGQLFWNGGMRVAFSAALGSQFSHFFLVNDDTELLPDALDRLLRTARDLEKQGEPPAIVVGATCDSKTGKMTYGGWRKSGGWNRGAMERVSPGDAPQRCDSFNGNCVLVPDAIARDLGNLDPAFTHSMGDLDYGFRARSRGYGVWLAPGFVAQCPDNSGVGLWSDLESPLVERWRRMLGPKGLPAAEWLVFTKRHFGRLWVVYWVNPYIRFWIRGVLKAPWFRKKGARLT